MKRKTTWFWLLGAIAAGTAAYLAMDGEGDGSAHAKSGAAAPLVSLVRADIRDMPIRLQSQGHVVPINEVDIRPQVEGVVRALHFDEGDHVSAGQLLFSLDAGDRTAQVKRARAQYLQTSAELEDARRNHARSRELVKSKYISSSALDATASKVDVLQAQQQAARAEIESAEVLLDYTRLRAPIAGKAGAVATRAGGLARPSDAAPLVRIVQMDPIAVEFTLPETALPGLLKAQARGEVGVSVRVEDTRVRGTLSFIDNSIDTTTGTLRLKAVFPNADERLWPGAFAQVDLEAGTAHAVVVLPPQAVLEGPEGHFVYRVGADGKALAQPVELLRVQDGVAVVSGLGAGERVVAEGNRDIRQGMTVRVGSVR